MSGGIGFDPSREWLGIDAVDLADPFRVLGLDADVADSASATAAAARLQDRLRGIDPGPFKRAHEALVQRIETCRDEVLATIAARRPQFVPPPPPAGVAAATLGPAFTAPSFPPPPPIPAGPSAIDPVSPLPATAEPELVVVRRTAPARRSNPSVAPTLLSLFALTLVGVAAYRLWPQPVAKRPQADATQVAVRPPQPAPAASGPAAPRPPIAVTPRPASPITPVAPSPAATPAINDESTPPTPPQPRPEPTAPPQPDPQAIARRVAAIEKALQAAYEAIRADEFDTADRQVAAAARLAGDDDVLTQRVTRWQQFTRYARQAADFRDQALNAANTGGDYDVGGQKIAVVESTPQRFVYRKAGRNVAFTPRSTAPDPVVTTILRAWFAADQQSGNDVFLGTHLIARREPNLRLAAAAWERARQGGEDVSLLVPLLTDPVVRAVATE